MCHKYCHLTNSMEMLSFAWFGSCICGWVIQERTDLELMIVGWQLCIPVVVLACPCQEPIEGMGFCFII